MAAAVGEHVMEKRSGAIDKRLVQFRGIMAERKWICREANDSKSAAMCQIIGAPLDVIRDGSLHVSCRRACIFLKYEYIGKRDKQMYGGEMATFNERWYQRIPSFLLRPICPLYKRNGKTCSREGVFLV